MTTEDIAKLDTSTLAEAAKGVKQAVKTAELDPAEEARLFDGDGATKNYGVKKPGGQSRS